MAIELDGQGVVQELQDVATWFAAGFGGAQQGFDETAADTPELMAINR